MARTLAGIISALVKGATHEGICFVGKKFVRTLLLRH